MSIYYPFPFRYRFGIQRVSRPRLRAFRQCVYRAVLCLSHSANLATHMEQGWGLWMASGIKLRLLIRTPMS